MRNALAALATALLVVWAISVGGATGWSHTVNWWLFGVALALLAARRIA